MTRTRFALCIAAILWISGVHAFDLPVDLGFQLGFKIRMAPAPDDASGALGLVVATHEIVSDKVNSLMVAGTITNFSNVARNCVDMRLAVTSYTELGTTRGRAAIEPASIPPWGVATFKAHVYLDNELPRYVLYTVTAQ